MRNKIISVDVDLSYLIYLLKNEAINPEDIFSFEELEEWAKDNNFILKE